MFAGSTRSKNISNINNLHTSVVTYLKRGEIINDHFTAKFSEQCVSEIIL